MHFTVRTEGDPRSVITAAREVVRELGTDLSIMPVDGLSDNLSAAASVLRAVTSLVVTLAISPAFLAALGLYAVVSHIVVQQRRGIAIRSVLGATPGSLLETQLERVVLILAVSAPAGAVVAVAVARLPDSLVYGAAVRDVGSLAASVALGTFGCLLATYVPVSRAAKADPLAALSVDCRARAPTSVARSAVCGPRHLHRGKEARLAQQYRLNLVLPGRRSGMQTDGTGFSGPAASRAMAD